ncbi:MAG: M56 family metallopeptidase [Oscillospiraceae bacterium]
MVAVFGKILNMSITAGWVILAILLVRLLLRKAPKKYSYVLWSAAAFRLCCPVSFSSVFSLFRLKLFDLQAAGANHPYVPEQVDFTALPTVDSGISAAGTIVNGTLPAADQVTSPSALPSLIFLAFCIWIIGVFALLAWAVVSYVRLRSKMSTAVLLEGNVYQSDRVRSPFILGFFRPKIYIPFGLVGASLRYVLAHERCHLKRLDHLVKPFAFLLLAVHWFNPLCWLAFYLMGKDMEMSCDEKVLAGEGSISADYSTVLLSFAANRRFPVPVPLAFGETGAKSRIKNALNWKRPKVWVTLLAVVLCVAVITACTADPAQDEPAESETPYAWTSTVQASDVISVKLHPYSEEGNYSVVLSESDIAELTAILNSIPSESIYTGRGTPAQLSVVISQNSQTTYLNYGGDIVEISFLDPSTREIWEIHDDALNKFLSGWLETLQTAYKEHLQPETADATVRWEYTPLLDHNYPGFPFYISNFFYTRLEATCSAGQLINSAAKSQGQSMTYTPKETLFWTPTSDDSLNVPSATIQFTIYDGDTELYHGTLLIDQISTDDGTTTYSARLSGCRELALAPIIGGPQGGALSRFPVQDLTEDGPVTLTASRLSSLHFKTNSTRIVVDFSATSEPVEVYLYATDAEGPLLSFSSDSKNLRSCSFSNLTASREYYLAIQCSSGTKLIISDG